MYCVSSELYDEVAARLCDAIGSGAYFSGTIEFPHADVACRLTASLLFYRRREVWPEGERSCITDVIPVWWEFHTVMPEGEVLNDFSFSELKRWLTV
ncbi:hypothetical protein [uncultured Alistipes sp.]|uniref:hypothetical protein n=1 Tax=uncultured Alistipes sp. TaxID=538949 RepID=UPI00260DE7FC|nr:hypothetical protein [uncultured Alistipes sp.]